MIAFWVDGVPATKGSWRIARGGKLRPDNAREKPWATAVAWSAKAAGVRNSNAPMSVALHLYYPRPKKPVRPFPSRNDVDKAARSCLDALTYIAWGNDDQVVELHVTKRYVCAERPRPGAYIHIREATP